MQYPRTHGFHGAELCLHYSKVTSFDDLNGDGRCIIGGSESGVDAAVALAAAGRRAVVFDREEPWKRTGPDPSQLLSPFTKARLNSAVDSGRVTLRGGCTVVGVRPNDNGYRLELEDGDVVHSAEKPILASGFTGSASLVRSLFDWQDDGFPLLTENDESTVTEGLFLVGPQVRQGDVIFCFIEAPMLRPADSPWSGCAATIPSCWLPREPNWTRTWPTCCRSQRVDSAHWS